MGVIARLLAYFSRAPRVPAAPAGPPLLPVIKRYTGGTIEQALFRFEDVCSEQDVDSVAIKECTERADGLLVHYDVFWNVSIFDDYPYGRHTSWALVAPVKPGAEDPPDTRFRVAAASADRHMKDSIQDR